ncbi:MAG: hypothetical protein ACRD2L_24630 [Terriglobia bacterium]
MTSTSFGLAIAYFLPGLAAFYSLSYWSSSVQKMFATFLTAESNVGLFLLVLAAALIIGLQIDLLRWLIFERLLYSSLRFKAEDFQNLGTDETKLIAFRAVADEHYRYHQFWGGMFISIPLFFFGWCIDSLSAVNSPTRIGAIVAAILLEVLTGYGAAKGFELYVQRGKQILKG